MKTKNTKLLASILTSAIVMGSMTATVCADTDINNVIDETPVIGESCETIGTSGADIITSEITFTHTVIVGNTVNAGVQPMYMQDDATGKIYVAYFKWHRNDDGTITEELHIGDTQIGDSITIDDTTGTGSFYDRWQKVFKDYINANRNTADTTTIGSSVIDSPVIGDSSNDSPVIGDSSDDKPVIIGPIVEVIDPLPAPNPEPNPEPNPKPSLPSPNPNPSDDDDNDDDVNEDEDYDEDYDEDCSGSPFFPPDYFRPNIDIETDTDMIDEKVLEGKEELTEITEVIAAYEIVCPVEDSYVETDENGDAHYYILVIVDDELVRIELTEELWDIFNSDEEFSIEFIEGYLENGDYTTEYYYNGEKLTLFSQNENGEWVEAEKPVTVELDENDEPIEKTNE